MVRLEGFYARALLRRQEKGNASGDAKLVALLQALRQPSSRVRDAPPRAARNQQCSGLKVTQNANATGQVCGTSRSLEAADDL
jgi:hypothetical protein